MTLYGLIWTIMLALTCIRVAKDFRRIEIENLKEENERMKEQIAEYKELVRLKIIEEVKKMSNTDEE